MEQAQALEPAVILLVVGILAIMLTRPIRLSPIVGYLVAGVLLGPHGFHVIDESEVTRLLAQLGVVFLLFDIGVHFSLPQLWDARRDILGLGPLQVALCTAGLAPIGMVLGLSPVHAILIAATLALSSTAVAVQTLTEQGQQNCPIGVTATSVLVFQDICAIFLLILASSLAAPDGSLGIAIALAALKAAAAFVAAIALARFVIGPMFDLLSRFRDEEAFTATALLIVLVTAGATGSMGLSLTLGAFLGGMIISETPYRHVIRTEVKPFRGLLLGFFFITVGMSLDTHALLQRWPRILLFLAVLIVVKTLLVLAAAMMLRIPRRSALQLGFLLSQGSELAFVIFSMPALRDALGQELSAVAMTGVAASLALTPALAGLGLSIATRMASREYAACVCGEAAPVTTVPPVVVFGMGEIGRRVADGLEAHGIPYTAIEMDHDRFIKANADGYAVAFGDPADLRLMETMQISERPTLVITIPRYEVSRDLSPIVRERYPGLTRFVAVDSDEEKARFDALGLHAVVDRSIPKGIDLAAAVLLAHGIDETKVSEWMRRQQEQALEAASGERITADAA